ncbi:MAG: hypothetical protein NC080_07545 [Paraprevotella sp.]|nr:hypothetical protein [Paraprevotella sp.]
MNEELERDAFEEWVKVEWKRPGDNLARMIKTLIRDDGEYSCPVARWAWEVWLERARQEEHRFDQLAQCESPKEQIEWIARLFKGKNTNEYAKGFVDGYAHADREFNKKGK